MSNIPYNYGSYIDSKVAMTDNGTVDAGKQMQSPASAGSRGMAKTMQFSKDKTQMQMGNSPIAESMIEIRSILNRIDGVNVPVQEEATIKPYISMYKGKDGKQVYDVLDKNEKSAYKTSDERLAQHFFKKNYNKLREAPVQEAESDYLYLRGKEIDQGSIVYDMQDYSDGIFELQSAKYADGTELDEKELEELESTQELIDWVMIDFVSESAVQEDDGDEQKWMNYAKFWKFVNEIFKDKAEEDISDQFISATTVDEEPSYTTSKELMQRQLKKQNTPFKINIDDDLSEFSNELNGRYEDETDMAKMKQAAIEIIKTGSTQIEPVKNAGTLSTYVQEDDGELARLKELSGIEENAKVNFSPEQIKQLMMWNKKYSVYSGKNGDELPSGLVKANTDSGITSDGYEENEVKQYEKMFGKEEFDWDDSQHGEFQEKSKITGGMISDLEKIVGVGNADDEYTLAEIGEKILGSSFGDTYEEQYQPFPEGDEFDIEEDEDFEEVLGPLGFPEDETELFDAEYQGRKVPLNKPMRGDTKKFKVYVKDPKTGNVKKVNFGHGGTSAKRKTMRIRKSNPKARKSFRARHNCANPGPKTKARYWSCRKW